MLLRPKTGVPENNSDEEWFWPYLIGQNPISPVFGQKRPGAPGNTYFAQFPPVFGILCSAFGHYMFLSGGLLVQINMGHKNNQQQNFAQVT